MAMYRLGEADPFGNYYLGYKKGEEADPIIFASKSVTKNGDVIDNEKYFLLLSGKKGFLMQEGALKYFQSPQAALAYLLTMKR